AEAAGYSGRKLEPEDRDSQKKRLDKFVQKQAAAGVDITPADLHAEAKRFQRRFIDGRKKEKRDRISVIIDSALTKLGVKASARAVQDWLVGENLVAVEHDGSISYIDRGRIEYLSAIPNTTPQDTARAHKKRPGCSRPCDGCLACGSWQSLNMPAPMRCLEPCELPN